VDGNVKEEITERTRTGGKFYKLVRDIRWIWKMPKKQKTCLFKS
jgi:hypothetical protein